MPPRRATPPQQRRCGTARPQPHPPPPTHPLTLSPSPHRHPHPLTITASLPPHPHLAPPPKSGVVFYISFILINAFVLINVVIGVLLEKCMVSDDLDFELTDAEKDELREGFAAIDKDGNGTLCRDEIRAALEIMRMETSEERLTQLIEKIDVDKCAASSWRPRRRTSGGQRGVM